MEVSIKRESESNTVRGGGVHAEQGWEWWGPLNLHQRRTSEVGERAEAMVGWLKEREKQPCLIGGEQDHALNKTERQLPKHSSLRHFDSYIKVQEPDIK